MQQKKLKEVQEKERNETERMKQELAENMTIVVLKQLLKDRGIVFSSKAKKLELVEIFHNTQAGYVTAYDGCLPKPKQFYFAYKHPPKEIDNHVVDSCQHIC